jgi:hypothetical protein
MTTLLFRQQGEQFFTLINGVVTPLAGGLLYYYSAGTTSPQTTYSELTGTIANTNPVQLDINGRLLTPIYFGSANNYKELLTDQNGVTISPWPFDNIPCAQAATNPITGFERLYMTWTTITTSNSPYSAQTANAGGAYEIDGSAGSVIINLPAISAMQAGTGYTFKRIDNSPANSVTIVPSGSDQIDGVNGAFALSPKAAITLGSDNASWILSWNATVAAVRPGGRLTLTSGTPVLSSDVTGASTVFYTAFESNLVPLWTGSEYSYLAFNSDLSLSLTSTILGSSSIVDVYAVNNSGALALGASPAWSNTTAGSCSRGTGAGTTQLARQNGIWTNAVSITLKNGSTTYSSIPAGQATYLGSIFGDSTAGQTSCTVSYGQSRKWGVWNAYNRKPILMLGGDSTSSWSYGTGTWRSSNNNSANTIQAFAGLAEETIIADFRQHVQMSNLGSSVPSIGIGVNSTTSPSGKYSTVVMTVNASGSAMQEELTALLANPPALGITQINMIEEGGGSNAPLFVGTQGGMQMAVSYLG